MVGNYAVTIRSSFIAYLVCSEYHGCLERMLIVWTVASITVFSFSFLVLRSSLDQALEFAYPIYALRL